MFANFVRNSEVVKNLCECDCQILPGMRARDLNNVKKQAHGFTLVLEMNRNRNIGLVIWGCPSVRRKAQRSIVFLGKCEFSLYLNIAILTCSIAAMRFRTFLKTSLTSRATVKREGTYCSGRPVFIMHLKPRSSAIANGRILSVTQHTISALQTRRLG